MPEKAAFAERLLYVPVSRVASVIMVAIILTLLLAGALTELTGTQIHYRNWLLYLFLQLIILSTAAWIAMLAGGPALEDQRSTALALFALSVGAVFGLTTPLLRPWFTSVEFQAAALEATLLGAILCTALGDDCIQAAGRVIVPLFVLLIIVCFLLACLLGQRSKYLQSRSGLFLLAFLAALCVSITLLVISEWYGDIAVRSGFDHHDPPRGGTNTVVMADPRAAPVLVATLFVFLLLFQASAFAMAMISIKPWQNIKSPSSSLGRLSAILLFVVYLVRDTTALFIGVAVTVVLIGSFAIGFGAFLQYLHTLVIEMMQVSGGWMKSDAKPTPVISSASVNNIDWVTPFYLVLVLAAIILVIWSGRETIRSVGPGLWKASISVLPWVLVIGVVAGLTTLVSGPRVPANGAKVCLSPQLECTEPEAPRYVLDEFEDTFEPVTLECASTIESGEFYWAYASPYHLSFEAEACRLRTRVPEPATILIYGTASRDDTERGGYALSARRAQFLAEKAHKEYPSAEIIVVALGRQLGNARRRSAEDDLYRYDRRIAILASPERWRVPMADARLQIAERWSPALQRGSGYEFCAIQPRIANWQRSELRVPEHRSCHLIEAPDNSNGNAGDK